MPPAPTPRSFTVLTANENATLEAQLTALSEDQCKAENEALPLEHQKTAQADVVQKVTLLASQDALPAHFIAGTAMVRPDGDLGAGDLVLDYEELLSASGAWENVLPAAASTVTTSTAAWSRCRTSTTSRASGTTRRSSRRSGSKSRRPSTSWSRRAKSWPTPATRRWPSPAPPAGRSPA